jgi:hypothetical protein
MEKPPAIEPEEQGIKKLKLFNFYFCTGFF